MAAPDSNSILMALGSGVVGIAVTMLGFFVKHYFTHSESETKENKSDTKKLVEVLTDIKVKIAKMEGERNTQNAKLYGKMKELETKLENYTRENNKLAGRVEQNTETVARCNTLLDHVSRQAKRLFTLHSQIKNDVEQAEQKIDKMHLHKT